MLMAVRVLDVFGVAKDEEEASDDGDAVAHLLSDLVFEDHAQGDEGHTHEGRADDPGDAVAAVTR